MAMVCGGNEADGRKTGGNLSLGAGWESAVKVLGLKGGLSFGERFRRTLAAHNSSALVYSECGALRRGNACDGRGIATDVGIQTCRYRGGYGYMTKGSLGVTGIIVGLQYCASMICDTCGQILVSLL